MSRLIVLISFILAIAGGIFAQNTNISNGYVFDGEPYMAANPTNPLNLVIAWMGYSPGSPLGIKTIASFNGGRTWSEGRDSQFPNPNAAVDFLRLASGHLLLVFNDSMADRTPLALALSKDDDRTWPVRRNLATGPYDYAYPYAIQTRDGRIHVVYTSHGRTVVNHAVFEESWIENR